MISPNRILVATCLLLVAACQPVSDEEAWRTNGNTVVAVDIASEPVITIGDIDPHTPTSRMLNIRPLADLIARDLQWHPSQVRIRIAQSVDQVAVMMADGRIDVYIDSVYPSVLVSGKCGSEIVLQSEVDGQRSYHSLLITPTAGDIHSLDQLVGRNIAFQERYSTSGYLLPAAHLQREGQILQYTAGPGRMPESDRTGFFFSGDEENTLALLRKNIVVAGALSSNDFDVLDRQIIEEFRVLERTRKLPRKLISFRQGFDPALADKLTRVLTGISENDRQQLIENEGWNWKFEQLDASAKSGIAAVTSMASEIELITP